MLPLFLAAVIAVYFALDFLLGVKIDKREPPSLRPGIPWIGHAYQILKKKKKGYYVALRQDILPKYHPGIASLSRVVSPSKRNTGPIFSLPTPRSRLYVVTDLALISEINRKPKTLQLGPYVVHLEVRVLGVSKEGTAILTNEEDGIMLFDKLTRLFHTNLADGAQLDVLKNEIPTHLASRLDEFDEVPTKVNLLEWLKHQVAIGTCHAIWGPANPINTLEMVDTFYTQSNSIFALLLNIFPVLTARQGYAARSRLTNAFADYYRSNGHAQASQVIQDRFTQAREHGISIEDMAALELSTLFAAVSNSVLATFWAIYHVYSSQSLLEELRQDLGNQSEREKTVQGEVDGKGGSRSSIFTSMVKETIRVHTGGVTTRYVAEDTTLSSVSSSDREYLLKRGSLLVIPTEPIHANTSLWGLDAEQFNPYRFCKHTNGIKEDGTRVSGNAFRAFGSGANTCPGRFLAIGGIERVVKMLVSGWDIKPVNESWAIGRGAASDFSDTVKPPDGDVEVWITRRHHR